MPDTNDNDIDALLRYLDYLVGGDPQWAHAVRALIAERNALKTRVMELEKELAVDTMAVIAAMRKGDSDGK